MSKIVKKSLFLIFVLFLSCTSAKDNYMVVYFDNGIIDDSPLGFPDFSTISHKSPEMILQLKDEQIDKVNYLKIEDAIKDGLAYKKENTQANNNAKMETIYLELEDSTKMLFFNLSDDFYDTENRFLFKNRDLANSIRSLINHKEVLAHSVNEDVPSPLYYKVIVRIKDEKM